MLRLIIAAFSLSLVFSNSSDAGVSYSSEGEGWIASITLEGVITPNTADDLIRTYEELLRDED